VQREIEGRKESSGMGEGEEGGTRMYNLNSVADRKSRPWAGRTTCQIILLFYAAGKISGETWGQSASQ
jgi:hypothetical protein